MEDRTAARRLLGASLFSACLLCAYLLSAGLLSACLHDWDALDPAKGDGSDACLQHCEAYRSCIAPDDSCEEDCEARVADCPTQSKLDLIDCARQLSNDCGGPASESNFTLCVDLITCWSNETEAAP